MNNQCVIELDSAWTSTNTVRCGSESVVNIDGERVCMWHALLLLDRVADREGMDFKYLLEEWAPMRNAKDRDFKIEDSR